ncbi:helix-turn-helix domain-containing protein (plasmid) [Embleya sp. NBC_00888]|uniref:helix-turn-helix domain-containing protein n=1 Tax=Embleya sp. NBC_00888 TaxID=2975960 RepID=UPI00386F028A|nr:helix-turn-helix domain-containing protein [Embleya sp. NBC_00888]
MVADRPVRASSKAKVAPLVRQDNPAAAVKVLGAMLRDLRRARGLGLKDAAPVIRASMSKISRLERGEHPPRRRDVLDLVAFYGADSAETVAEVEELLRTAATESWWSHYSDVTPGWLRRLISLEDSAEEIRTYEVQVVPGLLQTRAYARAVVRAGFPAADVSDIERRVDLRMQRQSLLRGPQRPKLLALLDESILWRPVGGPEVMAEQMRFLLTQMRRRRISVNVVRYGEAASVAPPSSVTVLRFAAGGPSELVYLEQIDGALYLSRESELDAYRLRLSRLVQAAEDGPATEAMLEQAITRYTHRA